MFRIDHCFMMNKINTYLLVLSLFTVTSCQTQGQPAQRLNVQEFESKLTTTKNYTLLDVRTPEEYGNGHLADATLINFYDEDFKKQVAVLDKTKPVYIYCAAGRRSNSAATILTDLGFKEVYDLKEGIQGWIGAGKPIVK